MRVLARKLVILLLIPVAAGATVCASGCGAGAIYSGGSMFNPPAITPKAKWAIYGDLLQIRHAIDGDTYTAAVEKSYGRQKQSSFTIDLGRVCLFNTVVIDHGVDEFGYCRTVGVSSSTDGDSFKQCHSGPGTRRVTILSLPTATLARYVRVHCEVANPRPWSVAEVYLQ